MTIFYEIMQYTFYAAIPLLIVALGGLFAEKSGVTNIALEGIMLFGGFFGIWSIQILERNTSWNVQVIYLTALLVGAIAGSIFSMLHAYVSIHMKSDQIISATALNLFAVAFVVFVARTTQTKIDGTSTGGLQIIFQSRFLIRELPLLSKFPFIGDIFFKQMYLSIFIGVILFIITSIVINKTRFGLRLRACGENPHAADSLGINIYKIRFIAVSISGAFAGLGGVAFVANTSTEYAANVVGFGFLAIAVLIFGNWKPNRILLAAMFFGIMRVLGQYYTRIPFLRNLGIPAEFYRMTPYIATLIVLALFSKNSKAPKALGQIYDQGKR
ncbi:MAG: ABC transporter permease [Acholeplasmataceae bacterium]|nr:ABC transporter permease [Acholeplasmataceae bacterium]